MGVILNFVKDFFLSIFNFDSNVMYCINELFFSNVHVHLQMIKDEVEFLRKTVENLQDAPQVVLCHNDINCPNLIYDESRGLFG